MSKLSCLIFFVLACCSAEVSSVADLNTYILDERNGLRKHVEVGDIKVEVLFRPATLWVRDEDETGIRIEGVPDSAVSKFDGQYYFMVRLSKNDREALHQAETFERYGDLLHTLSFRMGEYVSLTSSKGDTIYVSDFALNRTFASNTSTDLLFAFSNEKIRDDEWIQFNLMEFGLGLGRQRFRFAKSDLEKITKATVVAI